MITGAVTPNGIFIPAEVAIDGHGKGASIRLLVDSGANITAIHPKDADSLDLAPELLIGAGTTQIVGIGGPATFHQMPAVVSFTGADADGNVATWRYPINLHIAQPTQHNEQFPSILGRDILYCWRHGLSTDETTVLFIPKGQPDAD